MDAEKDFIIVKRKRRYKHRSSTRQHTKSQITGDLEDVNIEYIQSAIQNCETNLRESDFIQLEITSMIRSCNLHQVSNVVCYGLGNFLSCCVARYQLAFIKVLAELLQIKESSCRFYDPNFTNCEKYVLLQLGFCMIEINEEAKRKSEEGKTTLFYMPHCDRELYNNLLWANWKPYLLKRTIILGNSLTRIYDNLSRIELDEFKLISFAQTPLLSEYPLKNIFRFDDIFNDTSLHMFFEELHTICLQFYFKNSTFDIEAAACQNVCSPCKSLLDKIHEIVPDSLWQPFPQPVYSFRQPT